MGAEVEVTYRGQLVPPAKFPGKVTRNGVELDKAPSLAVWNHSPDGFAWGYMGSGPAQLALALLLDAVSAAAAKRWYQRFKVEVVASWPQGEGWTITRSAVREWWVRAVGLDELVAMEHNRVETAIILEAAIDLDPLLPGAAEAILLAVSKAWQFATETDPMI
jgi:hypothetical protein